MTEAGNLSLWNLNVLGELDLQFSGQATPVMDALLTFDGSNWRPIVPVISNTASYTSLSVNTIMAQSGLTITIEDNIDFFCKDLGNVKTLAVDLISPKTLGGNITLDGNVKIIDTLYVDNIGGSSPVTILDDLNLNGNISFNAYPTPTEGDVLVYTSNTWQPGPVTLSLSGFEKLLLHQDAQTTLQLIAPTSASSGVPSGSIKWTNTLVVPAQYDPYSLFSGSFREQINLDTSKTYRVKCSVCLGPTLTGGNPDPGAWKARINFKTPGGAFVQVGTFVAGEYVAEGTSLIGIVDTVLLPLGSSYATSQPFQVYIEAEYGNVTLGAMNTNNPPTIEGGSGGITVWEVMP